MNWQIKPELNRFFTSSKVWIQNWQRLLNFEKKQCRSEFSRVPIDCFETVRVSNFETAWEAPLNAALEPNFWIDHNMINDHIQSNGRWHRTLPVICSLISALVGNDNSTQKTKLSVRSVTELLLTEKPLLELAYWSDFVWHSICKQQDVT